MGDEESERADRSLIDASDVAKFFGMRTKDIEPLSACGHIPKPIKIGPYSFWIEEEIEEFIDKKIIERNEEAEYLPENHFPVSGDFVLCADLEQYRHRLQEFQPVQVGPCVYLLINRGQTIYVGQTVRLAARVLEHQVGGASTDPKVFDRVIFLSCQESDLLALEREFIKHFQPPLNSKKPKSSAPEISL